MEHPSVVAGFYGDSIFWVEVEKIRPNPYQPRKEFDTEKLKAFADSIRQYGILQPLTVSRHEYEKEEGGLGTYYELVAGERRLRAAKLLGLPQVPVLIRAAVDSDRAKLELAIIENLQREDLNSIDRAVAFQKLVTEFNLKHHDVAAKVGMSREFVANSIRLLNLPEVMQHALVAKQISEGHTRPLLMLTTRPEEQMVLFREIMEKKLTVREAESISRRIAQDRAHKKNVLDPEMIALERDLMETLGTRVQVERKEKGGKIVIDFFTQEDLRGIVAMLHRDSPSIARSQQSTSNEGSAESSPEDMQAEQRDAALDLNDKPEADEKEDEDLYSLKNFSL